MAASYATLPTQYSNKRKAERLTVAAAQSLHRMSLRMVPGAGANFSIYSALRTRQEQHALFVKNYRRRGVSKGASTDRYYQGAWWRRVGVSVAVPGSARSNHESGLAMDIHHGPIQTWLRANGLRFGWNWEAGQRQNEPWHFEYRASDDQYRSEGVPDIAGIQKSLEITADGKVGLGFVAAVRTFQSQNGLTVDGIAGPATQARILGGKAPAPSAPSPGTSKPVPKNTAKPGRVIPRSEWLDEPKAAVVLADHPDRVQTEIYIHHPGTSGTLAGESETQTRARLKGYYDDHVAGEYNDIAYNRAVDQAGRRWELRGFDRQSGANGGTVSNRRGQAILCLTGNNEAPTSELLASLEAEIAECREVHPEATTVLGHQQSPDLKAPGKGTDCPGPNFMALIRVGKIGTGTPAAGGSAVPAVTSGTVSVDGRWGRETTSELQGRLGVLVDGMAGPVTIKALQAYLGAPYIDGKLSRQPKGALDLGNGYRRDCIEVGSGDSQAVRLWQAYVRATIDGRLGEETIERTQIQLNASPASFTADHASTVRLRTKGVLDRVTRPVKGAGELTVDGRWGFESSKAWQRFLNSRTNAGLKVDGRLGPASHKAGQRYVGAPYKDGEVSRQSYRHTELGNGVTANGWGYTGRGSSGSQYVKLLQKWCGVTQDGIWYQGLSRALQERLNTHGVGM